METLRILVVEDYGLTAEDIKETLEEAGHEVIGIAKNFDEALLILKDQDIDLAIVDIKLEDSTADGIATAQALVKIKPIPIIYLTASTESKTFQRAKLTLPAAYLLKPFRHNELAMQVELAYHHYQVNSKPMSVPATAEAVFLPYDKGLKKINKQDVLYLKAEGAYVKVFLVNNPEHMLFSMNLGYLAQFFNTSNFYRLSRSLYINLTYLEKLEKNMLYLHQSKNPIQISEEVRAELIKQLAVIRTPRSK